MAVRVGCGLVGHSGHGKFLAEGNALVGRPWVKGEHCAIYFGEKAEINIELLQLLCPHDDTDLTMTTILHCSSSVLLAADVMLGGIPEGSR